MLLSIENTIRCIRISHMNVYRYEWVCIYTHIICYRYTPSLTATPGSCRHVHIACVHQEHDLISSCFAWMATMTGRQSNTKQACAQERSITRLFRCMDCGDS